MPNFLRQQKFKTSKYEELNYFLDTPSKLFQSGKKEHYFQYIKGKVHLLTALHRKLKTGENKINLVYNILAIIACRKIGLSTKSSINKNKDICINDVKLISVISDLKITSLYNNI